MPTLFTGFEGIGVSLEFDNLRHLCGLIKDFLEREQGEFKKTYDKKITEIPEKYIDEYNEWAGDNHWYLFEVFPSLQWMSLFNTSYGIFEKNLNYLCDVAKMHVNTEINVKDISGQGIERAKTYLTKVIGVHAPFNTDEWRKIKKYADGNVN